MYRGFVRVYRKIVDGVVFSDPPAFHLFMYLLLMANHKKGFAYGQEVGIGQVLTGRKKLAEAVAYSESGIEKIIKRLINYGLLEQQTFNKYRVLTIVNYKKFTYAEQQSDNRVTTEEQQSDTNKHYKNDKNDNSSSNYVDFYINNFDKDYKHSLQTHDSNELHLLSTLHTDDEMINAMKICVERNKKNIGYLKGVLNNKPKKEERSKLMDLEEIVWQD